METFDILYTGTSKADNPYKVSKRTTDIMLEILNLDKNEVVTIDSISNQEFTEVIYRPNYICFFQMFLCVH